MVCASYLKIDITQDKVERVHACPHASLQGYSNHAAVGNKHTCRLQEDVYWYEEVLVSTGYPTT
jgi:hypothetical protein